MRGGDSALRRDTLAAQAAVPCQGLCCCFCIAQPCQALISRASSLANQQFPI